uniref:GG17078 n=2 Tax=Drosophila erecta TaxID=7220 RepID=B3P183_DROER
MDSYPLLQYLDLSHSRIAQVEDDALGRLELLESLFLDHNLLMRVPSSLPPSLEHLFLQHNQIMELPAQAFVGLVNLQTLDLSNNRLIFLPPLSLPKLLTLNLQSSGVESVSQSIVHTLPQLRDLLLEDNPIKCSDLLGIAEWASPCRSVDVGQSNGPSVSGRVDLKTEYLQFHNFNENFSSRECGIRKPENYTMPPSCSVIRAAATSTTTPRSMSKVKKSKEAQATATSVEVAAATAATSEKTDIQGTSAAQSTAAATTAEKETIPTATSSDTTATPTLAAATMQSAGNSLAQLTTKTLRPTETTSLAQLQRRQQMPGMPAKTTETPAKNLPSLAQTKATTALPILATRDAGTATTEINSDNPTSISGATKTAAASAAEIATTPAIEVPQTILAGKKSDKMPADKAQETLLKYPTRDTSGQIATPPHKHATLQLHVKDRHLIGTPLLMHKGDVLLVDAEQLLLPGTATVADADSEVLDSSQQHQSAEQEKHQSATDKRQADAINGDTKAPAKSHKKKPSLSIKKMTYSTKHAAKTVEDMAATSKTPQHQHSSVNTPKEAIPEELSTFAQLKAYVELKSESKPEHLMDQREGTHHNLTGNHPGVMLLVSCVLFIVLLAGLAHVYRCELPWQRSSRSGQSRPHHQRHLNETDDAHSFLHYQGSVNSNGGDPARLQKWHHCTRREAPYSSPLHNLQARELQQQRCQQFYSSSLADRSSSTSSSSPGSSRSSLHSNSRDDSYYIEMAPSSPPAANLPSLPMELLGSRSNALGCRADRVAATDLGGTTEAVPSSAATIKSVSSRLMTPSSRRLNIW